MSDLRPTIEDDIDLEMEPPPTKRVLFPSTTPRDPSVPLGRDIPSSQLNNQYNHSTHTPQPNELNNSVHNPFNSAPAQLVELPPWKKAVLQAQAAFINEILPMTPETNKGEILDIISFLREYTEKGTLRNYFGLIQTQLTTISNIITNSKQLTRQNQQAPPVRAPPAPTAQAPRPASFAEMAAKGHQKAPEQGIIRPQKPRSKQPSKQEETRTRQLVLILQDPQDAPIDSMKIRNDINRICRENGAPSNVVATVEVTRVNKNIIITALAPFSATYLKENQGLWGCAIPFRVTNTQVNTPWFKVAIHGIPIHTAYGNDILELVPNEIKEFNSGLEIIGKPYWLSSEEKRKNPNTRAGSIVVAFPTKSQAHKAMSRRLFLFGNSCRTEEMLSTRPSYRCKNCQKHGHSELKCRSDAICEICAKEHPTQEHICSHCTIKGRACSHTLPSCANCQGKHRASERTCPTFQAIIQRPDDEL